MAYGQAYTRSIELAHSIDCLARATYIRALKKFFWCPCLGSATYNQVRPIHRQIQYAHPASRRKENLVLGLSNATSPIVPGRPLNPEINDACWKNVAKKLTFQCH